MNHKIAIASILAASIAAASATSANINTVGVINPNGHTIFDATGNSLTYSAFASSLATAYANDTGGVWNFDTAFSQVNVGDTITLNYGTSLANSLVMTLGGDGFNQGNVGSSEVTSSTFGMGLANSGSSTRTFTLATPLLNIGIFVGNRNDSARTSVLTVTYLDNTTASTSGANAGPGSGNNYFEDLAGTALNPIVSFSLSQNNFLRYDDMAFIVAPVPEPGTMALSAMGGAALLFLRRRRN